MKPIAIVAKSRQRGRCQFCGAPIEWALVDATARWVPLDTPVVLVPTVLEQPRIVQVNMDQTVNHFDTCKKTPRARAWRKFR